MKRKEQEIIVSHNDDGTTSVVLFDSAYARLVSHTFPGQEPVEQGQENKKD